MGNERRVALLTRGTPFRITGGYLYHLRMAAAAPKHGFHMAFFTVPDRQFPVPFASIRSLLRRVRAWRPDAVVIDSLVAGYLSLCRLEDLRVPVVGSLHQTPGGVSGNAGMRLLRARLDLSTYRRCGRLIAASESLARDLREIGLGSKRIVVVPPGKDPAVPIGKPRDLRKGRRAAALCVANWLPSKGILDLLEALEPLPDDLVTLHLAGDDSTDRRYSAKVYELLQSRSLNERVVVHGAVTPGRVAAFYRDADIFALPSYAEAFGTAFGEAMAAGLAVVGWRTGNLPNLASGQEAVILEAGDIAGLSQELSRLAKDESLRQRIGEAGRARSALMPSWNESAFTFFQTLVPGPV